MSKKREALSPPFRPPTRPLSTIDTQTIVCGDNLAQLPRLPDACVDLIYIDPPLNSNRVYETFWGETKEKRAFEDRHASNEVYCVCRPRSAAPCRPRSAALWVWFTWPLTR